MLALVLLTVVLLAIGARNMARGHAMGDNGLSTFLSGCIVSILGLLMLLISILKGAA